MFNINTADVFLSKICITIHIKVKHFLKTKKNMLKINEYEKALYLNN